MAINYQNNTDVIHPQYFLYIEGVQVPYMSMSISQRIGSFPTAFITIPPSPGIMDIIRYYQPKVHIFYLDEIQGNIKRLLFWGNIVATNFNASVNSIGVSFSCVHKNTLATQITVDYTGYGNSANANFENSTYKPNDLNSVSSNVALKSNFFACESLVSLV